MIQKKIISYLIALTGFLFIQAQEPAQPTPAQIEAQQAELKKFFEDYEKMSPAEQEALNQSMQAEMEKELAQMSPEQQQAFLDQQIQQGMAQTQQMLAQMTPEQQQEFVEQQLRETKDALAKMSPEERQAFDQMMNEVFIAQGMNPAEVPPIDDLIAQIQSAPFQATPEEAMTPVLPTEEVTAPMVMPTPAPKVHTAEEVAQLLKEILHLLELLRAKAAQPIHETRKLLAWKEALDDIIFDIKKINSKPEHHEQLATKKFTKLFSILDELRNQLTRYESSLSIKSVTNAENPYEVLRISPTASIQEIKATYERYSKERDPKLLRTKLEAQGLDENDIEGQLKSAKLSMRTIQDAYEKINDPKIRAQTDRKLASAQEQQQTSKAGVQQTLDTIIHALAHAVYQQNLIQELESFMQAYEPQALAERKKRSAAEAQRVKEQQEATKIQPISSPIASEPFYPQLPPAYQTEPSYHPGYFPGYDGGYRPEYRPTGQEEARGEPEQRPSKPAERKEERKPDKKAEEKKLEDKKQKLEDESRKVEEKKLEEKKKKDKSEESEKPKPEKPSKEAPAKTPAEKNINQFKQELAKFTQAIDGDTPKRDASAGKTARIKQLIAELQAIEPEMKAIEALEDQSEKETRLQAFSRRLELLQSNLTQAFTQVTNGTQLLSATKKLVQLIESKPEDKLIHAQVATAWKQIRQERQDLFILIQAYAAMLNAIAAQGMPQQVELAYVVDLQKQIESLDALLTLPVPQERSALEFTEEQEANIRAAYEQLKELEPEPSKELIQIEQPKRQAAEPLTLSEVRAIEQELVQLENQMTYQTPARELKKIAQRLEELESKTTGDLRKRINRMKKIAQTRQGVAETVELSSMQRLIQ